jgi:hypothetical protein
MISSATTTVTIAMLLPEAAQAFTCNGDSAKEYCTGYHDGPSRLMEII